jgi:xylulokinase
VLVPAPAEYVALGAARQAAWTLAASAEPPAWPQSGTRTYQAAAVPAVRSQYAIWRDAGEDK